MTTSIGADPAWDMASSTALRAIAGFQPRPTSASRACARIAATSNDDGSTGGSSACAATSRETGPTWDGSFGRITSPPATSTSVPRWSALWHAQHYAGCVVMPGSDGLPTTMKVSARHNHRPFRKVSSASSGRNRPFAACSGAVRSSARSFIDRSASRYICVVSMDS